MEYLLGGYRIPDELRLQVIGIMDMSPLVRRPNCQFCVRILEFQLQGKLGFKEAVEATAFIDVHDKEFHAKSFSLDPADFGQID